MKYFKHFVLSIFTIVLFSGSLAAQQHYAYLGGGIATIRGESTAEFIDNDYGYISSFKYFIPFRNERWVLTTEASHSRILVEREFYGPGKPVYRNLVTQNYLGVGLRYYLNKDVEEFNPYLGQILPFIGFSVGGLNLKLSGNAAITPGESTEPVIPGGYDYPENGTSLKFCGHGEGGFVLVLTPKWSIVASGILRAGFSDSWDGIHGKGAGQDYFLSGSLGMQYQF